MAVKVVFALCALALLTQNTLGCGCNYPASTGGSFVVTSSSPVAPVGISVVSDNLYEGALVVEGNLPLLGAVALEGTMGTAGAGAVSYGCGDGVAVVAEEGPIVTGIAPEAYGLNGFFGLGNFGYGLGNFGYGLGNYGYGLGNFGYGLGYGNLFGFGNGRGYYGLGLGYGNGLFGLGYRGF